jgi:DNA-binding NarL/FixJ family response regulator
MSMPTITLTEQQVSDTDVLCLLAEGCSNVEIAARLGVGPSTVKKRVERVYARIGVQSRQQQAADWIAAHGHELPNTLNPNLTDRQLQVLYLIAQGCTNAEIAEALGLSESSVKTHTGTVYAKIGARNRAQATRWAMNLRNAEPATA